MNIEPSIETNKRSRRSAIGGFLVLAGVAAGGVVMNRAVIQPRLEVKRKGDAEAKARKEALLEAREKVAGHLVRSDQTTAGNIETRVADIRSFFDKASAGVPAFAGEMLSWGSKWKLIKDNVLFWRDETEHKTFIEKQFAKHVFKAKGLEITIRKAVEDFISRDGEAVNNQFLADVRVDLPFDLLGSALEPERFQREARKSIEQNFATTAKKVYGEAGDDTVKFVGVSIASTIAGKVLVRVAASIATKMGLSAGILAVGAAGSVWTAGVTLLAAVILDIVLGWAMNHFTDPEGDLAETIRTELTNLETLIIRGAPATETEEAVVGVQEELETVADLQSVSRRDTMEAIFDSTTT